VEKCINTCKWSIVKDSEEEVIFIKTSHHHSEASTLLLYWISLVWIELSMNLLKWLKSLGRKMQKPSASLSTSRVGRMIVIIGTWRSIGLQRV